MDKIGSIEIRVVGSKGNIKLSPDSYDIKEIVAILQNIEDLLYPTSRKERPLINAGEKIKLIFILILTSLVR